MASRPWGGLRQDLLGRIFRRLPSITDRARSSLVCRHWRAVALENPPPLPWLLMPSTSGTSCFRVFGGTTHQHPGVPDGARFCGSFAGGWFVVALPGGHRLLNLHSGEQHILPDRVRLLVSGPKNTLHSCDYPIVIRAATLSAAPTPDGAYVVSAITYGQTNVAFWRPGMDRWSPPLPTKVRRRKSWHCMIPTAKKKGAIEDVVHYRRGDRERFYVLTTAENLMSYEPKNGADGALTMRHCAIKPRVLTVNQAGHGKAVARYLVVSGEDLLMVRRFASPPVEGVVPFQVFRLHGEEDVVSCSWRRWNLLEGQVLFVGRGCSKAYATGISKNPGPGYIYFLDDAEGFHDLQVILGQKQYRCSDTGRCHCRYFPQIMQRVLPRGPPSDCSPWIWFFQ